MASLSHLVKVSMFCDSILKLRNQCLSKFLTALQFVSLSIKDKVVGSFWF